MQAAAVTEPRRQARGRVLLLAALAVCFLGFAALGTWQLQRRVWKLELIERVEQRAHAAPVALEAVFPAAGAGAGSASIAALPSSVPFSSSSPSSSPAPSGAPADAPQWSPVNAQAHEYLHLQMRGRWLQGRSTWVEASTALGPGYWLIVPLQLADGRIVLINRGYVATRIEPAPGAAGASASNTSVEISGLLRLSEPHGRVLRENDAAGNRWYSRDVPAIAQARGLVGVAPFFIDADAQPDAAGGTRPSASAIATPSPSVSPASKKDRVTPSAPLRQAQDYPTEPVGGLTVIAFPNNHLVYALTWYALALMSAFAAWLVMRRDKA